MYHCGRNARFQAGDRLKWCKDTGTVVAESYTGIQMTWKAPSGEPENEWLTITNCERFYKLAMVAAAAAGVGVEFGENPDNVVATFV